MRDPANLHGGSPFALDAATLAHIEALKQQGELHKDSAALVSNDAAELILSQLNARQVALSELDTRTLALGQLDATALALGQLDARDHLGPLNASQLTPGLLDAAGKLALGQINASEIALGRLAEEQRVFLTAAEQTLSYGRTLADQVSSHQIAHEWTKRHEQELLDASKQIQQLETAYKPLTDLAEQLYREQNAANDTFANVTRGLDSSIAQTLGSLGLQELWKSAAAFTDQLQELTKDASYAQIVEGALWATQAITRDLRQAGFDGSALDAMRRQQSSNAHEAIREQFGISDTLIDRVIVPDPRPPSNEASARIGAFILSVLKETLLLGLADDHGNKAKKIAAWIIIFLGVATGETPPVLLHDLIKESIQYFGASQTQQITSDAPPAYHNEIPIPQSSFSRDADNHERKDPDE